ncbi:unnamed protein product [Rotaria sordida]|uniref:RanBD1 domain-containing protein n=2 Tax=Rotaria sordida TaxID=392033 RepID=A0A814A9B1_9BILA|nr:unnamed protein product [Rotaria sordida]
MSVPSSKPSQPVPTTFNERLNEQLVNCLNVQTNVIQNLSQYSQHISSQLFEIKNIVEILSNRVLALQQQQQLNQQPHFLPSHYATSYYPNYMSHQPIPVSHPPPSSHPPPPQMSFPVQQQQPVSMRIPTTTTTTTNSNLPFFPTTAANPTVSLSPNVPSFQFSTSAAIPSSQPAITNTLPTTTTPSKSVFTNLPKLTMADTTTKPSCLFPTTTTTTTTASTNITNEKPTNSSPFVFGTNNMTSIFGTGNFTPGLSNISTIKPETNVDDDGEGDGEEDYEPEYSFNRLVTLPVVEVKTGEEDENVLFCERAKLYRFDASANQMKERGVGEMKILQHKITNLCRILMRREQIFKICANHQITSQMELKLKSGVENTYVWSAMDFADGEAKHETLCIRFKTDEQAKKFLKVFNEAKEMNMKKSGDLPSIGKISLNDETKTNTNDDDIVSIGEVKPSAEQIDRAKKLQLPSTFYLYENKEPCKGCPGCEEDTPPIVLNENKTEIKQTDIIKNDTKITTPQPQSTTSASKTPLSSNENIKFSFTNAEKQQTQLQKQTSTTKEEKSSIESSSSPVANATSQYDNKPSIFGNLNGLSNTSIFGSSTPLNNPSGSIFGSNASLKPSNNTNGGFSFPGFGNTTTPTNGFQFSTPAATSSSSSTTTATTTANTSSTFSFGSASANKPIFGNTPKFSFSDLAKQSSTTTTNEKPLSNGTEQRVFAGQGSLIFGTTTTPTPTPKANTNEDDEGGDGGGGGGGEDESYEPNVSFKPIVQLSAVEVKTGEEDENILFCERAKLYRFDAETNQMKERGVGEIKILQHKTTNLCRILMRREQVLKLCANHQITSQMELKQHQGSENAYVWSAMDFADGEAKHETLCVRFKASDTAKRFVKQFNEAKQATINAQEKNPNATNPIFPPAQYVACYYYLLSISHRDAS